MLGGFTDVDQATRAFGVAALSGLISTTGVAGLTLAGEAQEDSPL